MMQEHLLERKGPEITPGEHVVVRCKGFRCLAYCDRDGKWFDASRHIELTDVLEVVQRFTR